MKPYNLLQLVILTILVTTFLLGASYVLAEAIYWYKVGEYEKITPCWAYNKWSDHPLYCEHAYHDPY